MLETRRVPERIKKCRCGKINNSIFKVPQKSVALFVTRLESPPSAQIMKVWPKNIFVYVKGNLQPIKNFLWIQYFQYSLSLIADYNWVMHLTSWKKHFSFYASVLKLEKASCKTVYYFLVPLALQSLIYVSSVLTTKERG